MRRFSSLASISQGIVQKSRYFCLVLLTPLQASLIGGPALGGLVIAHHPGSSQTAGLSLIYLFNAVSFLAVIWALVTMHTSGAPEPTEGKVQMSAALAEGLRFVFTTPLMVWTMGLDFLATFFSGATSLLPIFADQVLKVGAKGYGILAAAPTHIRHGP